jgi:hypothetical protein
MKTRAARLLHRLVESGDMPRNDIERGLCIAPHDLERLLEEDDCIMTLPQQLSLAGLLIQRVPRLARDGHALRGQVTAAIAFDDCETKVHAQAPATWRTLKRSPASRRRS